MCRVFETDDRTLFASRTRVRPPPRPPVSNQGAKLVGNLLGRPRVFQDSARGEPGERFEVPDSLIALHGDKCSIHTVYVRISHKYLDGVCLAFFPGGKQAGIARRAGHHLMLRDEQHVFLVAISSRTAVLFSRS